MAEAGPSKETEESSKDETHVVSKEDKSTETDNTIGEESLQADELEIEARPDEREST